MNCKTIMKLIIIGTLLTSCSQKGDIRNSKSSSSINSITSTESVNLVFKPLQMEQLLEVKPNINWKWIKEIL
jgi:hypothetical protein